MRVKMGRVVCCVALLLFIGACSAPSNRLKLPDNAREIDGAERLIDNLQAVNLDLKSYKGIGRLSVNLPEGPQQTRIAWIGAIPESLRVEVLTQPGGQPFASIASDGQWVYVVAHQEGRFVKKSATRSSLKRLIAIPIGPQDVYLYLAGRIPILPYDTARLYVLPPQSRPSGKGSSNSRRQLILTLKPESNRYPGQKIYMDGDTVRAVEFFDDTGRFLYRTVINDVQQVDNFTIPKTIYFSDDNQSSALIEVERIWTNVAFAPSVFQLRPPKDK
jgi:outer membrane lipoprotein-sorting protein